MELSSKQLTEACVYIRRLVKASVPYPDCEDVASDALLGWWEGISQKRFKNEASLKTYAYSITKHKIKDWLRMKYRNKKGNWVNSQEFKENLFAEKFKRSPQEKRLECSETIEKFMEGLVVCSPRQAEAVRLRFECDLTSIEAAEKMGISKRMYQTHLHQGMRKMLVRYCNEMRGYQKPGKG